MLSRVNLTVHRFPPATWVQGGDGENHDHRGTIICAAVGLKCIGKYYPSVRQAFSNGENASEQDWQGKANRRLRVS
jgi:hypothetical protein